MKIVTLEEIYALSLELLDQLLKTVVGEYDNLSTVAYTFYFINGQHMHKTNCMQIIGHILTLEEFTSKYLCCRSVYYLRGVLG